MSKRGERHVLITGANRGIGLEFCVQLLARGDRVSAVCRGASEALIALAAANEGALRIIDGVDVTKEEGLQALVSAVDGERIDVLINNAGLLRQETLDALDLESIRRQFEVNTLGPLRVTVALLGSLGVGSKVALITSRMGSIHDNTSGGSYGYRMSKAALNMAGKSLALDLRPKEIAVGLLHPGWVRTEMTGGTGLMDTDESVCGLLKLIDDLSIETTGGFWHTNGEALSW